jgi:copper chaperone
MTYAYRYAINGMTCGHCVSAVTAELTRLPGVLAVNIDLAAGVADVTAAGELGEADVRAAVDEAGYTLVGALP